MYIIGIGRYCQNVFQNDLTVEIVVLFCHHVIFSIFKILAILSLCVCVCVLVSKCHFNLYFHDD